MDLHEFGLQASDLLAGFFGGVVNVFVMRRIKPFDAIGSVVVGALAANYLWPATGKVTGTGPGVTPFLVGLAGTAICQGFIEAAQMGTGLQRRARTSRMLHEILEWLNFAMSMPAALICLYRAQQISTHDALPGPTCMMLRASVLLLGLALFAHAFSEQLTGQRPTILGVALAAASLLSILVTALAAHWQGRPHRVPAIGR